MKLALNKNALKEQRDQLTLYERFLPSLDLKRQQLQAAWKLERRELARLEQENAAYQKSLDRLLPLLGSSTLRNTDLSPLVRIEDVVLREENILGAHVPVVNEMVFHRTSYSTLILPFWVDLLVDALEDVARLQIRLQVQRIRTQRLAAAARKITQRVNLFEKILIPSARDNIRRIRIALSDEERAAVVRSKLAKRKRL